MMYMLTSISQDSIELLVFHKEAPQLAQVMSVSMGMSISMVQEPTLGRIDQEMQEEFVQKSLHKVEDQTRKEVLINSKRSVDSYLDSQAGLKPSLKEPPELELKWLPSHVEYAFLESGSKLE